MLTSRSGRSPHTGIVVALSTEARHLGTAARRRDGLATLRDGTLLAVTGVGRAAAGQGASRLVAADCRALVSFGLAGGLDPALSPGTILVPDEVMLEACGGTLPAAPAWCASAVRSLGEDRSVQRGRLLTSLHALSTVVAKAAAFRATGAVAVDMESFAVAEVAQAHQLPFLAVRVVVDGAADELPHALAGVMSPSGALSLARLIGRLVAEPASLAPLARLALRYAAARRSLRLIAQADALRPHVR
ncbi:MAG TPA: hypothetical protein VMD03_03650 [Steroidobacteraceae bacterium]|nr:hypothetical protein [Steroidobacteraceae bacterium]